MHLGTQLLAVVGAHDMYIHMHPGKGMHTKLSRGTEMNMYALRRDREGR